MVARLREDGWTYLGNGVWDSLPKERTMPDPETNSLIRLVLIVVLICAVLGSFGGGFYAGWGWGGYGPGGLFAVILLLLLIGKL